MEKIKKEVLSLKAMFDSAVGVLPSQKVIFTEKIDQILRLFEDDG